MVITEATSQGPRPAQEDRKIILRSTTDVLIGVFDGHGTCRTAELCADFLPEFFHEYRFGADGQTVLKNIVRGLDLVTMVEDSGSTASLVLFRDHTAHVAVIGDSPVLILGKDGILNVSPEHNIRTNLVEREAVVARGGCISNGYAFKPMGSNYRGLQMSRSLGDYWMREILEQNPEIYSVELGPESFVLVATDGLLDPAHVNTEAEIKYMQGNINAGLDAQALVNIAINHGVFDNVTAVLLKPYQTAAKVLKAQAKEEAISVAA